jgi:calcium-dependent protein kinase
MSYKNEANEKKLSEILGTPFYMAPEIFNGKYDNKVDLWACGILLYELLSGG